MGATKEKIARDCEKCDFHDYVYVDTFEEAMNLAVEMAEPGDAVLLSPACASWGMFPNYEVRGDKFIDTYGSKRQIRLYAPDSTRNSGAVRSYHSV